MPVGLVLFVWFSVAGVGSALATGFHLFFVAEPVRLHVWIGTAAAIAAVTAHAAVLRSLRNSSAWIRSVDGTLGSEATSVCRKAIPSALLGAGVVAAAATFGALRVKALAAGTTHVWLAYAAMVVQVHVSLRETFALFRMSSLKEEVADRVRRRKDPAGAAPTAHA
jgi:hypothetical protein